MTASDEAKKVLEGVTPGPWDAEYDDYGEEIWFGGTGHGTWTVGPAYLGGDGDNPDLKPIMDANARFIAWSREGVPALLAEIAAKDAEIARMKDALKPFADRADRYDPPEHDDEDVDWDTSAPRLRVKHLRTAREVLKGDTHE